MLNKRNIYIFVILAIFASLFAFFRGSTDVSLEYSPEIGYEMVLKYPFWVSKKAAKESFDIQPEIEGELRWVENKLHFIPTEGFEPGVRYTVNAKRKLTALLPLSREEIIQVAIVTPQEYVKPKISDDTYIDVNLATMTLSLYKKGKLYKTFPVAGKGHPRLSPTIEGEFKIRTKEPNHFSSLAHVWMPLSMQFYGDYFIHAWPYWPGGAKLTSKYSGGCVRLFDDDAKEVYGFAQIGMTILIHSTPSHRLNEIKNGDLMYMESDPNAYVVQIKEGVRFKRAIPRDKILSWYPDYTPLDEHMKLVSKDVLDQFATSRWVRTPSSYKIYELNKEKHLMACGGRRCMDVWAEYGWDPREIYIISEEEFASYQYGDTIELPKAPWVQY